MLTTIDFFKYVEVLLVTVNRLILYFISIILEEHKITTRREVLKDKSQTSVYIDHEGLPCDAIKTLVNLPSYYISVAVRNIRTIFKEYCFQWENISPCVIAKTSQHEKYMSQKANRYLLLYVILQILLNYRSINQNSFFISKNYTVSLGKFNIL